MKLSDFDYNLPKELIAQEPVSPRDHSRLLLLRGACGSRSTNSAHANNKVEIEHKHFYDIVDYFQKGDVLVLNNSKVFPARLIGQKKNSGGKVEVFLHQKIKSPSPSIGEPACRTGRGWGEVWNCMLGGRVKEGLEIELDKKLNCRVLKNNNDGTWEVEFNKNGKDFMAIIEKIGKVPLPPYIHRAGNREQRTDKNKYQTVYADEKKVGSVAAPTAGFHFTSRLMKKLRDKGVQIEYVTLHVGLGTFAPVKTNDIKDHKMHSEFVEIKKGVAQRILKAKKENRRIIAVGTTSVRTLEAVFSRDPISKLEIGSQKGFRDYVNIFIYPGYKFKIVDAMITNFHLPKSTLLMLISALAGKKNIDKAYKEAIKEKYRFYSYGDAMFIC